MHCKVPSPAPTQPQTVQPPAVTAAPSIRLSPSEQSGKVRELRPSQDVSISTTLRAVVLGGVATGSANVDSNARILAPRSMPAATPTVVPQGSPSIMQSVTSARPMTPEFKPDLSGLQNLFMTTEALSLRAVASLAAALPGVVACVVSGSCGNAEGGNFSAISVADAHAKVANFPESPGPSFHIVQHEDCDFAAFIDGAVRLGAVISKSGFVPGVKERLAEVAAMLAGGNPRQ